MIFVISLLSLVPVVESIAGTVLDPGRLTIEIWTDRGSSPWYYPNEEALVYYRTSRDAHVTIYDIDTAGNVRVLSPREGEAGRAGGRRAHRLFERSRGRFIITGPAGTDYVVAVASPDSLAQPKWPVIAGSPDSLDIGDAIVDRVSGSAESAIVKINRLMVPPEGRRSAASAVLRIRVSEPGAEPKTHILISPETPGKDEEKEGKQKP